MKAIISAANNYIDKKKAERAAENMAWQKVREDIAKADSMFDDAIKITVKGWDDLEESCHIQDPVKSDAMADIAVALIAEGSSAEYDAGAALTKAEDAALALAKGDHKVMLHKTKYMVKPEPTRMVPYM